MPKISDIVSIIEIGQNAYTKPIRIVYRDSLRDDAAFCAIFDERWGDTIDNARELLNGKYALCDVVEIVDHEKLSGKYLTEFFVSDFRNT